MDHGENPWSAAGRYTECRLAAVASAMLLEDLAAGTVDFIPNFDSSTVRAAAHGSFGATILPCRDGVA